MPVGIIAAAVSAGASIYGANKAASAQKDAANADINYQTQTRDLVRSDLAPWRTSGEAAQNALSYEYGLSAAPAGYQGFQKTQDYTFGLDQGIGAVQAGAAARGGLYSGAAMKALNTFGQDYASQRRGQYLNGLANLSAGGQNAAAGQGQAAQNAANGVSNALSNYGNAASAGYVGTANAINSGIGNALGAWQYQKAMGGQSGLNIGQSGSLFGGNSWG